MKNADEAKDYGLDVPIYTIEYTDDNDDVISVYFGNNTGDNIYATLEGEKSIYTVSSQVIEDLNYTEEDLIQLDDYPSIGSGNLEKAVITQNKNSVVYDSADETQTEQIIAIAGGLGAVQLSTTADYCAEEKELSEYGLDEDLRAAVEVTYQEDEKEKKSARETVKELSANTGDKEVHDIDKLDSGITAHGILEVMQDGYGFIRSANYLPGENDVYVSPSQIRRFNLKTGDILEGNTRIKTQQEKFSALLYLSKINEMDPMKAMHRKNFEDMTPIFPNERLSLECGKTSTAMRIMDLMSPIGKGQRGMIVSPPKAGKTTLLKQVALSVQKNNPEVHLLILLIDERPEEVTDIRESIEGPNVEVIYSTFDELPEHHKRVSEMVIERAKRLVEHKKDVMILIDSITRLARAYNLTVPPSGRTLSGGLDPAALHMPKRFFGAARNMREGGSLTILATALVDTGSKMDDVVYEEFKGTGNMELVLDRKLSEKRMFPAIDILKSGTRREDLLLSKEEQEAVESMRRALNGLRPEEAVDNILNMFSRTQNNEELIQMVKKTKFI